MRVHVILKQKRRNKGSQRLHEQLLYTAVACRRQPDSTIIIYILLHTFDENVIPSTQVFHLLVTRRDKYALIYDFSDVFRSDATRFQAFVTH